jgi:DNA-binding IclR family transcriptional regulator
MNGLPSGAKAPKAGYWYLWREMKMLQDREKILSALREKPLKVFEIMKRANIPNQEACQSLLLKMRDEGAVKFDIHKGQWLIG